jgi:hypothetical protein
VEIGINKKIFFTTLYFFRSFCLSHNHHRHIIRQSNKHQYQQQQRNPSTSSPDPAGAATTTTTAESLCLFSCALLSAVSSGLAFTWNAFTFPSSPF